MKASYKKYVLHFNIPVGTSRGQLSKKTSYFISLTDKQKTGIGEVSIIKNLSIDDNETKLERQIEKALFQLNTTQTINYQDFIDYPSLQFGLETAMLDFLNGGNKILFPSKFTEGQSPIKINGLIWMGNIDFMLQQIDEKLNQGYDCLKLKIGALTFENEINVLNSVRKRFSKTDLMLRVDANGAFNKNDVELKLHELQLLDIHSIEQPIMPHQLDLMENLCAKNIVPIALDEELIGVKSYNDKSQLLDKIKPQYLILKPSLLGGFAQCDEWIELANQKKIGWWITSALESNIGLNAISQYVFSKENLLHQGLGTGKIYRNNISSPLELKSHFLYYNPKLNWAEWKI